MALSEKQHEERRRSIGGSDAVKIMWGNHEAWRALYNEKINGVRPVFPQKQQDLMDMGTAMEPLTLAWFAREHHRLRIIEPDLRYTWKVDKFFSFTPDAITADDMLPVQAKFHTGDKSIIELADYYGAQLLHEMLCMGTKKCYLVVTFGHYGRRQMLTVEQDEEAVAAYLQRAMQFKEYCLTGVEPEWMARPVNLNIPRKRDHVWEVGNNLVAELCTNVLIGLPYKARFEAALEDLKLMVPDDAATAKWVGHDGIGLMLKVARNGSKRWYPIGPEAEATAAKVKIDGRKRKALTE